MVLALILLGGLLALTLVPTFIAIVPAHLPLDASLVSESPIAVSLREAIERPAAE